MHCFPSWTHRLMVLSSVRGLAGPLMYLFPNWTAPPRGHPAAERLGGTTDISNVSTTTLSPPANVPLVEVGLKLAGLSKLAEEIPRTSVDSPQQFLYSRFPRFSSSGWSAPHIPASDPCWSGWWTAAVHTSLSAAVNWQLLSGDDWRYSDLWLKWK